VIIINEGKIIAKDDVKNLTQTFHKAMRLYLEVDAPKSQFISEIKKIKGILEIKEIEKIDSGIYSYHIDLEEGKDLRKEIVARIVKNNWGLLELKKEFLTLEDVFLKLVTKEEV